MPPPARHRDPATLQRDRGLEGRVGALLLDNPDTGSIKFPAPLLGQASTILRV